MGSPDRLLEASAFVHSIEKRKNIKIGCIEETSYLNNNINLNELKRLIRVIPQSDYKNYLSLKYENKKIILGDVLLIEVEKFKDQKDFSSKLLILKSLQR